MFPPTSRAGFVFYSQAKKAPVGRKIQKSDVESGGVGAPKQLVRCEIAHDALARDEGNFNLWMFVVRESWQGKADNESVPPQNRVPNGGEVGSVRVLPCLRGQVKQFNPTASEVQPRAAAPVVAPSPLAGEGGVGLSASTYG